MGVTPSTFEACLKDFNLSPTPSSWNVNEATLTPVSGIRKQRFRYLTEAVTCPPRPDSKHSGLWQRNRLESGADSSGLHCRLPWAEVTPEPYSLRPVRFQAPISSNQWKPRLLLSLTTLHNSPLLASDTRRDDPPSLCSVPGVALGDMSHLCSDSSYLFPMSWLSGTMHSLL